MDRTRWLPRVAAWLVLLAAAVLGGAPAARADGTVLRARDCGDRIFVSTGNDTYSVLTATGSNQGIADGDLLVGEVERIGFSLVYDRTAGRSVSAMVEERRLDRAQVNERIRVRCRTEVSQAFIHGTVSRADGCSGRIIVNTDKGYAILQRLAGGMVADGDTLRGDFNQAGRATVKDDQTGATLTVFVEDFQLPKSATSRKIQTLCRR